MLKHAGGGRSQRNEQSPLLATGDGLSLSLFSPIPGMFGVERYPSVFAKAFPNSPNTAYRVAKGLAIGGAAALLVAGVRAATHVSDVQDMLQKDNPIKGLGSDMSTTFTSDMLKKSSYGDKVDTSTLPINTQRVHFPNIFSTENVKNMAIPLILAGTLTAGAYKLTDAAADTHRNSMLKDTIAEKKHTLSKLMQTRARVAKGLATDAEVESALRAAEDESTYVKVASGEGGMPEYAKRPDDGLWQQMELLPNHAVGVLGTALTLLTAAAGVASYSYFKQNDKRNIKHKAIKKGIKEYSRTKALTSPLTIAPGDAEGFFGKIDGGQPAARKATPTRDMPEVETGHQPISITI